MSIVLALLGLSLVVFVHELGHYCGALLGGMRVKQFAIGFGPRLFGLRRGGTDYRVNAVPFGGYVMVDGALPDEGPSGDPRQMQNRPAWARVIYTICGPIFNLAFAFGLFLAITGIRGLPVGRLVMISELGAGSPAAAAGLRVGDRLLAVDGVEVTDGGAAIAAIGRAGSHVDLLVERDGEKLEIRSGLKDGRLLVQLREQIVYSRAGLTPGAAVAQAWSTMKGTIGSIFGAIGSLLSGRAGLRDLTGPVGMIGGGARAADLGWEHYLTFLAFIGVNLGLFNLLPLPALDGGRLLFLALEKATGGRLGLKLQAWATLAGFALLIVLLVLVTVQDIFRAKLF